MSLPRIEPDGPLHPLPAGILNRDGTLGCFETDGTKLLWIDLASGEIAAELDGADRRPLAWRGDSVVGWRPDADSIQMFVAQRSGAAVEVTDSERVALPPVSVHAEPAQLSVNVSAADETEPVNVRWDSRVDVAGGAPPPLELQSELRQVWRGSFEYWPDDAGIVRDVQSERVSLPSTVGEDIAGPPDPAIYRHQLRFSSEPWRDSGSTCALVHLGSDQAGIGFWHQGAGAAPRVLRLTDVRKSTPILAPDRRSVAVGDAGELQVFVLPEARYVGTVPWLDGVVDAAVVGTNAILLVDSHSSSSPFEPDVHSRTLAAYDLGSGERLWAHLLFETAHGGAPPPPP